MRKVIHSENIERIELAATKMRLDPYLVVMCKRARRGEHVACALLAKYWRQVTDSSPLLPNGGKPDGGSLAYLRSLPNREAGK